MFSKRTSLFLVVEARGSIRRETQVPSSTLPFVAHMSLAKLLKVFVVVVVVVVLCLSVFSNSDSNSIVLSIQSICSKTIPIVIIDPDSNVQILPVGSSSLWN